MLLFRSEDHLQRWLVGHGHRRGGTVPVSQLWEVVRRWYDGRLEPDWRGLPAERAGAILAEAGLTGPLWRMG